jgi:hypothetical protein
MITQQDITKDDFKTWFSRDFLYETPAGSVIPRPGCPNEYVRDADIDKAFIEAQQVFNAGLFGTDQELTVAYLYLTAFYLVNDLQTSAQGLGSTPYFMVNSRTVGGVSESYEIPEWVKKDPILSAFSLNRYGQKYISLIKPLLVGNVQIAFGWTTFE